MARTEIKVFDVGLNAVKAVAPVDLDATNDMYFKYPKDNVTLVVSNTDDTNAITVTAKGVNGNSDKVFSVAKSSTVAIGNLESAAVKQSDGTVLIDIGLVAEATASGTIFGILDVI